MRKITLLFYGMITAALVLVGCATQVASPSATQPPGPPAGQSSPKIDTFESLVATVALHIVAKPSVHFVLGLAVAGHSFTGDGDGKLGAQPALQLTMSVPPFGHLSGRLIDGVWYLKLPGDVALWVRVDPTGDDPIAKTLGESLRQLKERGDPAQSLKRFEGAAVLTAQQSEQLNGKATTHYSITVDMKKVSDALNDFDLKKVIAKALLAGVDTFPVELWLDQEYLPVRTTLEIQFRNSQGIPLQNSGTRQSDRIKITVDYSDWGKPVTISAPPDEQVVELPH